MKNNAVITVGDVQEIGLKHSIQGDGSEATRSIVTDALNEFDIITVGSELLGAKETVYGTVLKDGDVTTVVYRDKKIIKEVPLDEFLESVCAYKDFSSSDNLVIGRVTTQINFNGVTDGVSTPLELVKRRILSNVHENNDVEATTKSPLFEAVFDTGVHGVGVVDASFETFKGVDVVYGTSKDVTSFNNSKEAGNGLTEESLFNHAKANASKFMSSMRKMQPYVNPDSVTKTKSRNLFHVFKKDSTSPFKPANWSLGRKKGTPSNPSSAQSSPSGSVQPSPSSSGTTTPSSAATVVTGTVGVDAAQIQASLQIVEIKRIAEHAVRTAFGINAFDPIPGDKAYIVELSKTAVAGHLDEADVEAIALAPVTAEIAAVKIAAENAVRRDLKIRDAATPIPAGNDHKLEAVIAEIYAKGGSEVVTSSESFRDDLVDISRDAVLVPVVVAGTAAVVVPTADERAEAAVRQAFNLAEGAEIPVGQEYIVELSKTAVAGHLDEADVEAIALAPVTAEIAAVKTAAENAVRRDLKIRSAATPIPAANDHKLEAVIAEIYAKGGSERVAASDELRDELVDISRDASVTGMLAATQSIPSASVDEPAKDRPSAERTWTQFGIAAGVTSVVVLGIAAVAAYDNMYSDGSWTKSATSALLNNTNSTDELGDQSQTL